MGAGRGMRQPGHRFQLLCYYYVTRWSMRGEKGCCQLAKCTKTGVSTVTGSKGFNPGRSSASFVQFVLHVSLPALIIASNTSALWNYSDV